MSQIIDTTYIVSLRLYRRVSTVTYNIDTTYIESVRLYRRVSDATVNRHNIY